jgi:hypothetical protein
VATRDAVERWDKVLDDVQRANNTPIARNIRRGFERGQSTEQAFRAAVGPLTTPLTEVWQEDAPSDPALIAVLQPVVTAAESFDSDSPAIPQIDDFMEVVATARAGLNPEARGVPTVEEIIADMQLVLKVILLVAGTSHIGSIAAIDREVAERSQAILTGATRPPKYFDFVTNAIVDAPSETTLSMAMFVAIVNPGQATSWAEMLQPDPADQPPVMKQFASQAIVNFYTEWEEYYRVELAAAHQCSKYDLLFDYFGDLGRLRQDYVHNRGRCGNSAHCSLLKWFSKGQLMIPTPANYLQLLTDFPADELRQKPSPVNTGREKLSIRASIPVIREFEKVAGAERPTKGEALDEALAEWTAKNQPT